MSNRRGQWGHRAQLLGVTDNKLETWRIDGYTASCRRGWQGQAVSPPQSKAQARRFTTSRSANLGFCGDGSGWVGRSAYHGWPQPCTLWPWKPPAEGRVAEGGGDGHGPLNHSSSSSVQEALTTSVQPSSECGCGTGHLPTAIAAAFHVVRTLVVQLALVLADTKLGEVHTGAGTLLFKVTFFLCHSRWLCPWWWWRGGDLTSL